MRELHLKFRRPKVINIVGISILVGMAVMGLYIIKNVNSEFAIRNIAGKFQEYKYGALSFNNIYSGLPGDITNATFYWKDTTRDGDGDKMIKHETGEGIAAWQQLQLAKVVRIAKVMSGKWDVAEGVLVPDMNVPSGNNPIDGFYLNYSDTLQQNIIGFGEASTEAGVFTKAALTPNEAYALDLLMDDGYPDKGILIADTHEGSTDCFAVGEYKKEAEVKECILIFKL